MAETSVNAETNSVASTDQERNPVITPPEQIAPPSPTRDPPPPPPKSMAESASPIGIANVCTLVLKLQSYTRFS